MRIKKKEIMEAANPTVKAKVDSTVANFKAEKEVIDAASDFKNSTKGIIKPEVTDEITNFLADPNNTKSIADVNVKEEKVIKPKKKRVKEVVKVKNLKK